MEHRNLFTEEMLRQLYQRRGYQVMRLCGEVSADRQKAMELTFQAFAEANRRLALSEDAANTEYQDQVLLECTRRIVTDAMPQPQQAEVIPQEPAAPVVEELPILEDLLAEEPAPAEEPAEEAAEKPVEEAAEPAAEPAAEDAPVPEAAPTMAEKFGDLPAEEEPAPLDLTDTSGSSFGWGLLVLVLLAIVIGLLWAIWGVAQNIFPIPRLDLGYEWFNANVYPLF